VPLARLKDRVFTTADTLNADVEVAHFGHAPLASAAARWQIVDVAGKAVAGGDLGTKPIPRGKNIPVGTVSADLSKLAAPAHYKLMVELREATKFRNEWNFWLYPAELDNAVRAEVLVTSAWPEAEAKLAAGGKVLFVPKEADLDSTDPKLSTVPIFWNHLMNPNGTTFLGLLVDAKHPALAAFPSEANCDWQWVDLFTDVRAVNIDALPHALQPIVQPIDDWNRNYRLAALYECAVDEGKLMVCSFNLEANRPGAPSLRRSILDYMASAKFKPAVSVHAAELRKQWATLNPHVDPGANQPAAPSSPDLVDPGQIRRRPNQ
jgi:hypothetical protein